MGLRDIIASAVATADGVTKDLHATVTHTPWLGYDDAMGASVSRKALVEYKQSRVRTPSGQEVMSRAYVAFIYPVTVTYQDIIILPDGTTGPIVAINGFADRKTGGPYLVEVYLG